MTSIDESSTDDDSGDGSRIINSLKDIRDGNYVHPEVNARDYRLNIRHHIYQELSEWKVSENSAKTIDKVLLKVFKAVVN